MSTLSTIYGAQQTKRFIFAANKPTIGDPILSDSIGELWKNMSYARNYSSISVGGGYAYFGGTNDDSGSEGYLNKIEMATGVTSGQWMPDYHTSSAIHPFVAFGNGFHLVGRQSSTRAWKFPAVTEVATPAQMTALFFVNGVFWLQCGASYYTSADAVSWSASKATPGSFVSIVYANGLYVAVDGYNANVYTSPDGTTWTTRVLGGFTSVVPKSVAYGNGKFAVVCTGWYATSATSYYSTDGATWTAAGMPEAKYWLAVTYGNGCFVAVGGFNNTAASFNGVIAISSDGVTWRKKTLTNKADYSAIVYDSVTSRFVLVCSNKYVNGTNTAKGSECYKIEITGQEIVYEK